MAAMPAHEGASGSAAADRERNRQLLQKWKADPEHYARLQRDLRDFWDLPREERLRIRKLDRELHQLNTGTQKRLWKAMERYSEWLEKLPEEERKRIEQMKDSKERLRLIKEVRQRQWIDRLPKKVREDLLRLPKAEQLALVAKLRQEERQQRKLWQKPFSSAPNPRPAK
jgi:hypothetical protein